MNISFLPSKIKTLLADALKEKLPLSVVRSSSTPDGESGETYLVSFEDKLFVFSRKLGESDYSTTSELFGQIANLKLRNDGMNTYLDASFGEKNYSLKFSSFEDKNLQPILDAWQKAGGATSAPSVNTEENVSAPQREKASETLTPLEGLAAALMYISAVDNHVSSDEKHYITTMFAKRRDLLDSALAYYKRHSFEDLITILKPILTHDQKLCYLANMMEVAMKDMVLHSSERHMLSLFADETNVAQEEIDAIRQVLMIKNKISVLNT